MKKTLLALAATATALTAIGLPATAYADGLSFNVGGVTEYRYRGISQTRLKPALQGGVDYAAGSFYVGAWASTIKWIKDAGGDASAEIDLYAGYKGEISKGLGFDVGVLTYQYPSNRLPISANTTELYGALSYGPATLKYSHSVTNLFGFDDSKGSGYLDLSATFEVLDGWTLTPHLGHQSVKHDGTYSYTDYALILSKDFNGLVPSIALIGTDTDAYVGGNAKNLGKSRLVLGLKYTF